MTPELKVHMENFDDLGFNNDRVYSWHKNILVALENNGYKMNFYLHTDFNNKQLFQDFMLKSDTFNFLNNAGLVNTGFCPITGEQLISKENYNIYGRVIYLSPKGTEVCKLIDRNEWTKENGIEKLSQYNQLITDKEIRFGNSRKIAKLFVWIKILLSIIFSYLIVKPNSLVKFLIFFVVLFIIEFIIGRIMKFFLNQRGIY